MDLKIYSMFAGALTIAISFGFIAGVITTCKLIRFGIKATYDVQHPEVFNKKSSSLVDALAEKEQESEK